MLSKCANPACNATFHYLHLGKLFAIEYRNSIRGHQLDGRIDFVRKNGDLRYFWLCPVCCQSMTIQINGVGRVRIASSDSAEGLHHAKTKEGLREATQSLPGANGSLSECTVLNAKRRLDALEKELEFLEGGGYRQPMGWRPILVFEDSPICPKPPFSACPDTQCVLMDLVPEGIQEKTVPCQHIPLNEAAETLHTLYSTATMDEIENALREWLRKQIAEMKETAVSKGILSDGTAA